MQDERNTPQDEDAEEVEGHVRIRRSEEAGVEQEGDEDEVEAHSLRPGAETRIAGPETRVHEPSE